MRAIKRNAYKIWPIAVNVTEFCHVVPVFFWESLFFLLLRITVLEVSGAIFQNARLLMFILARSFALRKKNKTEIFTHTPFLLIHVAKQRMVFRSNTFPNNLIKQQIDLYRKSGLVNLAVEMWYVASLIRWDFCLIRWLMRKFFCCDLLLVNSHGYNQTICA